MKSADNEIIGLLNRIHDAQAGGGGGAPAFAEITGAPEDNTALEAALDAKGPAPSDTAYDEATWNGVTTIPPSKNAVRDEMELKQTAAQVQALIDAAPRRVIGTAKFDASGGSIASLVVSGIVTGVTYNGIGNYSIDGVGIVATDIPSVVANLPSAAPAWFAVVADTDAVSLLITVASTVNVGIGSYNTEGLDPNRVYISVIRP